MKLARGLESQDEPPSWNARELVFPRRHFSNNPLFMASFPAAGAAVSPNGTTGSMGGQPRHLYLEWESCNGIVSSRLVHPSDGVSGEKVKFE